MKKLSFLFLLLGLSVFGLQAEENSYKILFRLESFRYDPKLGDNEQTLKSLKAFFSKVEQDTSIKIQSVFIKSYASPDGLTSINKKLATKRVIQTYALLKSLSNLPDSLIRWEDGGIAWDIFRSNVQQSDISNKEKILEILDSDSETRLDEIKRLDNGNTYRYFLRECFPDLRRSDIYVYYSAAEEKPLPDVVSETAKPIEDILESNVEDVDTVVSENMLPRFAVKTNVPILLGGIANAGVEMRIGRHMSVELPVIYSPYTIKRNYKMRILSLQPEYRYWFREVLKGHFIGVHGTLAWFNIALDNDDRYQDTEGKPMWGAGLTYGYSLSLTDRLALEFTAGVGYSRISYDVFYNVDNGVSYNSEVKHYWGVTKAGINLVYKF